MLFSLRSKKGCRGLNQAVLMSKQIAYSRVHLPDGTLLRRCVVEFDNQGVPLRYFPLTEELPFVEWHDCDYYWP